MLSASLLVTFLILPFDGTLDAVDALRSEGRLDDAMATLEEALRSGDGDTRALSLALADLRVQSGLGLEALEAIARLDNRADHDVVVMAGRAHRAAADQVYFNGGSQEEIDGHFEEAIAAYERALELSGDDTSVATWLLGNIYLYDDNNKDHALQLAQHVLDDVPDDAYGLLLRGAATAYTYFEHFSAGDTEAANAAWQKGVDDLLRADELLPESETHALGQLAWYYEAQGMAMKAVDTARAIVDREKPPSLDLLYKLARKYRDVSGGLEASGRALEKLIATDETALNRYINAEEDPTAVAVSLSGSIDPFYQRGDKGTCRRILAAIVTADPKDAQTWSNYAVICEETSRFEDAVKAYERAIELDPENPRTYNDLGAVFQHNLRRETDRSRELYEKCIALSDVQMNQLDATEATRARAREARNVAQGNLGNLTPAASGNLLDSMMEGLRSLNLPKDGEGETKDDGAAGAGAAGSGGNP